MSEILLKHLAQPQTLKLLWVESKDKSPKIANLVSHLQMNNVTSSTKFARKL